MYYTHHIRPKFKLNGHGLKVNDGRKLASKYYLLNDDNEFLQKERGILFETSRPNRLSHKRD